MQIGGGINADNAAEWLDKGASHVIVTSYVFRDGRIDRARLKKMVKAVGRERLVLDLSCRKKGNDYYIVTDRWQKFTEVVIAEEVLGELAEFCDEFLIHAADVEGKCAGIECELVEKLAQWTPIPTTYAGGIRDLHDLQLLKEAEQGWMERSAVPWIFSAARPLPIGMLLRFAAFNFAPILTLPNSFDRIINCYFSPFYCPNN